ncbi:MAG TPA: VWA domain-containing protein [Acidobacteriaceae bacterium]|nr:VWA domain-containing protein [Acidobacteriaceae bacterium]
MNLSRPSTAFPNSRLSASACAGAMIFGTMLAVCGTGTPLYAQTQPVPASQKTPAAQAPPAGQATAAGRPVISYDPTKPEVQPNLSVDRDPVMSPDLPEKPSETSTTGTGKAGEIQKGKGGIYTLHEDVNEVVLNCTVVTQKGKLVDNLTRNEVRVWEDDVPQTINSFQHQDVPVSLGILVDNSGSMRDKRAAVNAATLNLVKLSNPKDAAFIVNFSDKAYLDQDFTSNIADLERGLSHIDSRNTTALYDAVAASADELAHNAKHPKQALLIITDGADNASRLSLQQAIRRVQSLQGPVVYSIGLLFGDSKEEALRAKTSLETLSNETGGLAYFPASLENVDEVAQDVARDIRDQYTIGYHSTKDASLGGYRRVRVEATSPKLGHLIVRTRKGYYPKSAPGTPQPNAVAQNQTAQPASAAQNQPAQTPPAQTGR